jgi:hypothetical protein
MQGSLSNVIREWFSLRRMRSNGMCSYMYTSPSPLTIFSMKSLKVVDSLKLERAIIIHPAGPNYRPIPFRRSPENLELVLTPDIRYSLSTARSWSKVSSYLKNTSHILRRRALAFADSIAAWCPSVPIGGGWIFGFRLSILNMVIFATKAATIHSTEAQVVRSTWHMPSLKLTGRQMTILTTRKMPREKNWKVANLPGRGVESRATWALTMMSWSRAPNTFLATLQNNASAFVPSFMRHSLHYKNTSHTS